MEGTIPKNIHFVWFGPTFDKFERARFESCKALNGDYTIHLWIDVFSMMGPEAKSLHINGYLTSEDLGPVLDAAVRQAWEASPIDGDLRHVTALAEAFQTIKGSHDALGAYLKDHEEVVLAKAETALQFKALCQPADKVKLHFLDEEYPKWRQPENPEEVRKLVDMLLFEKLARGGNFGSASDMARLLVLYSQGGIYCDHDTVFEAPFGELSPPHGFYFAISTSGHPKGVTNAVIASKAGHVNLLGAMKQTVMMYSNHFSDGELLKVYVTAARPVKKPGAKSEDTADSPFEKMTLDTTGPGAFNIGVLAAAGMPAFSECKWPRAMLGKMVTIMSKKAWL